MRRYNIYALCIALIMMSGCSVRQPFSYYDTTDVPLESEARLHDVSLPLYRDMYYHTVSDEHALLVEGTSPLSLDDVVRFYIDEFERDGWHCVTQVQSDTGAQLVWMRPLRIATVMLEQKDIKRGLAETRFILSVSTPNE